MEHESGSRKENRDECTGIENRLDQRTKELCVLTGASGRLSRAQENVASDGECR